MVGNRGVILYDDSDGWYDHQMPPIVNPSFNPAVDTLNGPGVCNTSNGFQQGKAVPRRRSTATSVNRYGAAADTEPACRC